MAWSKGLQTVEALLPTRIRIPLRLRIFFRGAFALLALAHLAVWRTLRQGCWAGFGVTALRREPQQFRRQHPRAGSGAAPSAKAPRILRRRDVRSMPGIGAVARTRLSACGHTGIASSRPRSRASSSAWL